MIMDAPAKTPRGEAPAAYPPTQAASELQAASEPDAERGSVDSDHLAELQEVPCLLKSFLFRTIMLAWSFIAIHFAVSTQG